MTQALYAHMSNKRKKEKENTGCCGSMSEGLNPHWELPVWEALALP
jgi:hypothetical protein